MPTEEADIKRLYGALLCTGLIMALLNAPAQAFAPRADTYDLPVYDLDIFNNTIFRVPLATEAQGCNTQPGIPGMAPALGTGAPNSGTAAEPNPVDVYFNYKDIVQRGAGDKNDHPWTWAATWAQLICGAAPNSTIDMSFFFVRSVHNSLIPETDAEIIYRALEWVKKYRNVTITMILEGQDACLNEYLSDCFPPMPPAFATRFADRWVGPDPSNPIIGTIKNCIQGCVNRAPTGTYAYAINHEKFIAISNTIWSGKPLVLSSSSNISRGQFREYHEELSLVYGDVKLWQNFDYRAKIMKSCVTSNCSHTSQTNPADGSKLLFSAPGSKYGNVWYDPILHHPTDAGRGTTVAFSPQRYLENNEDDSNIYLERLKNVACTVDPKVRIAMFKMTDHKASQFVAVLKQLKARGCDVKTLLTSEYGKTSTSPTVKKMFNDAGLWLACSALPMHTKMVLIGPATGSTGRVMHGTQNMDIAGQYLSEEHTITYDARAASNTYRPALQQVYAKYSQAWIDMSKYPTDASQGNC